jgi:hypothetical protein
VPSTTTTTRAAVAALATTSYRLPRGSARAAVVAHGTDLWVLGGFDGAKRTTAGVLRVDTAAGSVAVAGTLPQAVHDNAGALVAGRPTSFGGGNTAETDAVQAVDAAGHGAVVGHLPIPRSDVAAATVGTAAYLVGGYDGARVRATTMSTLDGSTFTLHGDLPVPVRYAAVTARGGEVVSVGGTTTGNASGGVAAVQVLDPATGAVRLAGSLPNRVSDAVAATVHDTIYVFGGFVDGAPSDRVWRLDLPSSGAPTWTVVGHLPTTVTDAGVAVIGDTAYLVGGETGAGQVLDTVSTLTVR